MTEHIHVHMKSKRCQGCQPYSSVTSGALNSSSDFLPRRDSGTEAVQDWGIGDVAPAGDPPGRQVPSPAGALSAFQTGILGVLDSDSPQAWKTLLETLVLSPGAADSGLCEKNEFMNTKHLAKCLARCELSLIFMCVVTVLELLSDVQLLVTPWTVACQAPLSMGFHRQEYWSGLPCPPPGDLPNPGIEPVSPALQADSLPLHHLGSPSRVLDCI